MRRLSCLFAVLAGVLLLAGCGSHNLNQQPPSITHTAPGKLGGPPPGNPAVGDVLFATPGKWSGSPTGFAYAWKACDSSGANCSTANGSPTNITRYQIAAGDIGSTIRVAVTASYSGHPDATIMSKATAVVAGAGVTFPLSVAASGRTLVDAASQPFLMVADSPQSLIGDNSVTTMESFIDNRAAHGFNTLWANVLCDDYTFCNSNGQAVGDGGGAIKPFTSGTSPSDYDMSTPNSTYFSRIHTVVAYAKTKGIEMILDPIETGGCDSGGWMTTLEGNGNGTTSSSTDTYKYGQFLGTTFGDLNNIIWMSGNDFQCVGTTADNNDVLAVAMGIRNTDPGALQTMEPDGCSGLSGFSCEGSSSLVTAAGSSSGWSSVVDINGTYTYSPMYAEDRLAYGQSSTQPVVFLEGNYEGEEFSGNTDGCITISNCRLQEWWTMTSGGAGQLYGNYFTDAIGCGCSHGSSGTVPSNSFNTSDVNTTAVAQLQVQTNLLTTLDWQDLVPDANGTGHLITSGGGTCPTTHSIETVNCVTAAITADKKLALIYDPQSNTITVDLSKMNSTITARWFDPTSGDFTTASGSPFANTGTHSFAVPSTNDAGDSDWVLLLQAS